MVEDMTSQQDTQVEAWLEQGNQELKAKIEGEWWSWTTSRNSESQ